MIKKQCIYLARYNLKGNKRDESTGIGTENMGDKLCLAFIIHAHSDHTQYTT